jgi:hypothetical protein
MNVSWLEPWTPVESGKTRSALETELHRELSLGHPLHGRSLAAIARRADQDDVLFALDDGSVAEVHLTWRGRPEDDPRWPRTEIFPSAEAWIERRMKPLYEEVRDNT